MILVALQPPKENFLLSDSFAGTSFSRQPYRESGVSVQKQQGCSLAPRVDSSVDVTVVM